MFNKGQNLQLHIRANTYSMCCLHQQQQQKNKTNNYSLKNVLYIYIRGNRTSLVIIVPTLSGKQGMPLTKRKRSKYVKKNNNVINQLFIGY